MGISHYWLFLKRLLGVAILCGIVLFATGKPTLAQVVHEGEEYYDLVLGVEKKPHMLSQGLIALQKDDAYYLPLKELSSIFTFVLQTDLENGKAKGWYIKEQNTFSFNLNEHKYTHLGETFDLSPDQALIIDAGEQFEELYVHIDLLNKIWPVSLRVDETFLILNVFTEEKLPFEIKLERQKRRERYFNQKKAQESTAEGKQTNYPYIDNDYKALNIPTGDIQFDYEWTQKTKIVKSLTNFSLGQDIAGFYTKYGAKLIYEDGVFKEIDGLHITAEREAFGNDTLPLGGKKFKIGDVALGMSELVSSGIAGRGMTLTSESAEQRQQDFDTVFIEGEGIPGWEIEVYRNSELLKFEYIDQTGRYRFENIPLRFGKNEIRVIQYGPQGQIREKVETYTVGGQMKRPGSFQYTLGFVQQDRNVFRSKDPDINKPEGLAVNGRFF